MMKPTIHLSGTDVDSLSDQYSIACHTLHDAIDHMIAASPNGRDYYVQGPEAFKLADQEHRARIEVLTKIKDEVFALYEHCEGSRQ